MVRNYREAYDMFLCNSILFNHESPHRGERFVTGKVTRSVAKIALGHMECFELGNLNSRRDWGHAKDYVQVISMRYNKKKKKKKEKEKKNKTQQMLIIDAA